MTERLLRIFDLLLVAFGKRNWWPADSALEVMVGAILTQNTSWKNVEKAIASLKSEALLDTDKLYHIGVEELAQHIRSSGFYNLKARRLKAFITVLHDEFHGSVKKMKSVETWELRERLLAIPGVGAETADSILLYALQKPVFVVDAYTKRFLRNHHVYNGDTDYDAIQTFFTTHLPRNIYLYNEFHALIVCLGKQFCKNQPACTSCPLQNEGRGPEARKAAENRPYHQQVSSHRR